MRSITFRLSDKLKAEFDATLEAREMAASNVLRDSITNFVRNHKRQFGKPDEEQPVTASKSAKNKPDKKSVTRGKLA